MAKQKSNSKFSCPDASEQSTLQSSNEVSLSDISSAEIRSDKSVPSNNAEKPKPRSEVLKRHRHFQEFKQIYYSRLKEHQGKAKHGTKKVDRLNNFGRRNSSERDHDPTMTSSRVSHRRSERSYVEKLLNRFQKPVSKPKGSCESVKLMYSAAFSTVESQESKRHENKHREARTDDNERYRAPDDDSKEREKNARRRRSGKEYDKYDKLPEESRERDGKHSRDRHRKRNVENDDSDEAEPEYDEKPRKLKQRSSRNDDEEDVGEELSLEEEYYRKYHRRYDKDKESKDSLHKHSGIDKYKHDNIEYKSSKYRSEKYEGYQRDYHNDKYDKKGRNNADYEKRKLHNLDVKDKVEKRSKYDQDEEERDYHRRKTLEKYDKHSKNDRRDEDSKYEKHNKEDLYDKRNKYNNHGKLVKYDRLDRHDKPDKYDKPNKYDNPDKYDKPDKYDIGDKYDTKRDKLDKKDKYVIQDKQYRYDKSDKYDKTRNYDKPNKDDKHKKYNKEKYDEHDNYDKQFKHETRERARQSRYEDDEESDVEETHRKQTGHHRSKSRKSDKYPDIEDYEMIERLERYILQKRYEKHGMKHYNEKQRGTSDCYIRGRMKDRNKNDISDEESLLDKRSSSYTSLKEVHDRKSLPDSIDRLQRNEEIKLSSKTVAIIGACNLDGTPCKCISEGDSLQCDGNKQKIQNEDDLKVKTDANDDVIVEENEKVNNDDEINNEQHEITVEENVKTEPPQVDDRKPDIEQSEVHEIITDTSATHIQQDENQKMNYAEELHQRSDFHAPNDHQPAKIQPQESPSPQKPTPNETPNDHQPADIPPQESQSPQKPTLNETPPCQCSQKILVEQECQYENHVEKKCQASETRPYQTMIPLAKHNIEKKSNPNVKYKLKYSAPSPRSKTPDKPSRGGPASSVDAKGSVIKTSDTLQLRKKQLHSERDSDIESYKSRPNSPMRMYNTMYNTKTEKQQISDHRIRRERTKPTVKEPERRDKDKIKEEPSFNADTSSFLCTLNVLEERAILETLKNAEKKMIEKRRIDEPPKERLIRKELGKHLKVIEGAAKDRKIEIKLSQGSHNTANHFDDRVTLQELSYDEESHKELEVMLLALKLRNIEGNEVQKGENRKLPYEEETKSLEGRNSKGERRSRDNQQRVYRKIEENKQFPCIFAAVPDITVSEDGICEVTRYLDRSDESTYQEEILNHNKRILTDKDGYKKGQYRTDDYKHTGNEINDDKTYWHGTEKVQNWVLNKKRVPDREGDNLDLRYAKRDQQYERRLDLNETIREEDGEEVKVDNEIDRETEIDEQTRYSPKLERKFIKEPALSLRSESSSLMAPNSKGSLCSNQKLESSHTSLFSRDSLTNRSFSKSKLPVRANVKETFSAINTSTKPENRLETKSAHEDFYSYAQRFLNVCRVNSYESEELIEKLRNVINLQKTPDSNNSAPVSQRSSSTTSSIVEDRAEREGQFQKMKTVLNEMAFSKCDGNGWPKSQTAEKQNVDKRSERAEKQKKRSPEDETLQRAIDVFNIHKSTLSLVHGEISQLEEKINYLMKKRNTKGINKKSKIPKRIT